MKVGIIGGGNVGATLALFTAQSGLADVVLLDIVEGVPQGKALDMMQARAVLGFSPEVVGTNDYKDLAGCNVVVITAGFPRKPGMSRDDLVVKNAEVITSVCTGVREVCPDCIIIMVTNPLDAMSYLAMQVTGFPRERVLGMAGVLDAARFRAFIGMDLDVHPESVAAMVLGGHGDSMVPVVEGSTVNSTPLKEAVPSEKLDTIVERTRKGGAEIVALLKTGSAYYAPAASAFCMLQAIAGETDGPLPVSVLLQGEYGIHGVFVGVPVHLGSTGLMSIEELFISDTDLSSLQSSAQAVKDLCESHFGQG
ncbi:malate dehydrogenase [Planctomycetota bacterium]